MGEPVPERVAALHRLLVETEDDLLRAEAHVELAQIALEKRRVDLAIRHFREAVLLDPSRDSARKWLRTLGEAAQVPSDRAHSPGVEPRQESRSILARVGSRLRRLVS